MKKILIALILVLVAVSASAQPTDAAHPALTRTQQVGSIAQTRAVSVSDSLALVPASLQYAHPSFFKRIFLGSNYRSEWSTPVKMKVFDINKTLGGLTITELGGGKQTHSVTLKDKQDREWKLRTVDKDPTKVLPSNLQIPVAIDIVQDMISAAHPYAPLAVPTLAHAADIPHGNPVFYFVPDDPALGEYRALLADKVMILEEKDATPDNSETKNSEKLMENMMEDNDHRIDQQALLKARLLDILIADWDRHIDQWRWGVIDTGKGKTYYPVPVDRDQAFFYSDGLAMRFATMRKLPFMKGLRYSIKKANWLGFSARNFDRMFLNELEEPAWRTTIANFRNAITNDVITEAVSQLPPEVFRLRGPELTAKLKSRRDDLHKAGMTYYKFLSKQVNIFGSNEQEHFFVSAENGRTKVEVSGIDKSGEKFTIYSRSFDASETKEIRLFGLKGNDVFKIHESANDIKLRVVGGEGSDSFAFGSRKKVYLYDSVGENNYVYGTAPKNRSSRYPHIAHYKTTDVDYKYNQAFPIINIGFNTEDGLLAGIGFKQTTHSFDKLPFASENRLTTLYSFLGRAYQVRYAGIFTDAISKLDLVAAAELQAPALANFFGLGNDTKRAPNTDMYFYRARYRYLQADAALKYDATKIFSVLLGPSFYHYWNNYDDNSKRILGQPELVGLDSSVIYATKTYAGGRLNIAINSINNEMFPTKGLVWSTDLLCLGGLNNKSSQYTRAQSDFTWYKDLYRSKLIGVVRLGGGHIFSDQFEYFQAMALGANTNLRGYRKTRFAGSSAAYNNLELRVKVADVRSYLFPGTLGVIGFNDVGRVWLRNETSNKWHHSYGGGLYYLPFNIFILSATAGISPEETLFNISLGTKINLIF